MSKEQEEKKGIMGVLGKLSMKGELLGGMEKEAAAAVMGDILEKVTPFITPFLSELKNVLGTEYMAIIRNEGSGKDQRTVIIVIENILVESFKLKQGAVVLAMSAEEFISLCLDPSGGIEKAFKDAINKRNKKS